MNSPTDWETPEMSTTVKADDTFLRRILFALIFCAVATGGVAAYAAVSAEQAGVVHLSMSL
jgi:hypothetical protein